MARVYIDNKKYDLNASYNLLQACLSVGLNIPYFCWHPLIGSIGACRQCAVIQYNDSKDQNGRLIMSCMTPVTEGSIISINHHLSQSFRKDIVELLLTNHPHDCPVCEEGGNCHLQDMSVMTHHSSRNYIFKKRTHNNQYLGSFIKHEMNRCIGCYRCVRYYQDYADGTDLSVYGSNNNIYFGRIKDGSLESEHSGNLIEICPTGVFTDKIHSKQYNRKWDMQYAPGVCQHCSIGCNIIIGERYGEIRRIENRYHEQINHYLICDLGRFGHSYTNLNYRPTNPTKNISGKQNILSFHDAINFSVDFFKKFNNIIGVGSIRSSIENNFALQELVGEKNFSNGMSDKEQDCILLILNIFNKQEIYFPTLREIEDYDIIFIIGEDITQTSSRISLAIRQAVKKKARDFAKSHQIPTWNSSAIVNLTDNLKNSLYIFHTHETKLDDLSKWCYYASVYDQVQFLCALAHGIDSSLPLIFEENHPLQKNISLIIKDLMSVKKVLIVSGTHSLSTSMIKSALNLAQAIKKNKKHNVGLTFLTPASNSLGIGMMGGMSIESALKKFNSGKSDAIIFMEYDIYRYIEKQKCDAVFENTEKILSLDHQFTQTYQQSGLSLSVSSTVESTGTVVNFEGRAQRFFQVYDPNFYDDKYCFFDSWKWLHAIYSRIHNIKVSWFSIDDVVNAYVVKYPFFACIKQEESSASFRIHDQKVARSPNRFSGRTALRSHIDIHEIRQPQDLNSILSFSMEGYHQPSEFIAHIPFPWSPGWNSPQAWNKFQTEVGKNLISGNSGVFLFKKNKKKYNKYFNIDVFAMMEKKTWYIVPYYTLFGSEELTQYSHIIQKNMSIEYLLMNELEALKLGLKKDSIIEFYCLSTCYRLPIKLSQCLQSKQIGLPIGRKNFPMSLIGQKIKYFREFIQ